MARDGAGIHHHPSLPIGVSTKGRSRERAGQGYRGPIHPAVWDALERAYEQPFRIESNYAREMRFAVAFAASVGWITVVNPDGLTYSRDWKITVEGLYALRHNYETKGSLPT